MNHPSARLAALLMTVGLLGAGQVHADYTNWSYQWTSQPSPLSFSSADKASGVSFSGASMSTPSNITPSGVSPINITTNSTAGTSQSFDNSTYKLFLKITDNSTNDSQTIQYNGSLSGSVSSTASSLINTIQVDPSTPSTFTLDGHNYAFNLTATPSNGSVGAPGSAASILQASVVVDGTNNNTSGNTSTPATVPEPSSLLLAGLACMSCGVGGWRRARPRARLV